MKFNMINKSRRVRCGSGADHVLYVKEVLSDWEESHDGELDVDSPEQYIEESFLDVDDFVEQEDGTWVWHDLSVVLGIDMESYSIVYKV